MLDILPEDLIRTVLEEFVSVSNQAASLLDVAFCNHKVRHDWLALLGSITIHNHGKVVGAIRWGNCLRWFQSRQLPLNALWISDLRSQPAFAADVPPTMPMIESLMFYSRNCPAVIEVKALKRLLAVLPNLTAFRCHHWPEITDEHLNALCKFSCPLKKLALRGCKQIGSDMVAKVVHRFAASLEVLYCDVLDDSALRIIAQHCRKLKGLTLSCEHIFTPSIGVEICVNNASHLESLELDCNFANSADLTNLIIVNVALKEVIHACTKLRKFYIRNLNLVTANMLQDVLACCPDIHEVKLCDAFFTFEQREADGKTVCCVECNQQTITENFFKLFAKLDVPLADFNSMILMNREQVRIIAEKEGADLTALFTELDEDVDEETMLFVLQRCPNLKTLFLTNCSFSANCWMQFPRYCRSITDFNISESSTLNDSIAIALLEEFKKQGIVLTGLGLDDCALTNATLVKIVELFPGLNVFSMLDTYVTKEAVLELILAGKLRAKEISCPHAGWVMRKLKRARHRAMPNILWDEDEFGRSCGFQGGSFAPLDID